MSIIGPKGYQKASLNRFKQVFDPAGKRILEVGGCNLPPEFLEREISPEIWVSVDPLTEETHLALSGNTGEDTQYITHLRSQGVHKPGEAITSPVGAAEWYVIIDSTIQAFDPLQFEGFDCIVSMAAFEHIHNLKEALEVMLECLRPGGMLWTRFSPIWSGAEGHHHQRLSSIQKRYGLEGEEGLVPPFAHLLWSPGDMTNYLSRFYEQNLVKSIINSIYETQYINRLFFDDYERLMKNSGFADVQLTGIWHKEPSPEIARELSIRYPDRHGFDWEGIEIIARKDNERNNSPALTI